MLGKALENMNHNMEYMNHGTRQAAPACYSIRRKDDEKSENVSVLIFRVLDVIFILFQFCERVMVDNHCFHVC